MSKQHLDIQNLIFGLSSNIRQHLDIQNLIFCGRVEPLSYACMFYLLSLSNASDSTIPFFMFL